MRADSAGNFDFTAEEKANWVNDPVSYLAFRKKIEAELQGGHIVTMRGNDAQKFPREDCTQMMRNRLSKKPKVAEHLRLPTIVQASYAWSWIP